MVTPTGLVLGRTLSTEARVDRSDDGSSLHRPCDLVMHNRSGTSRRSSCLDINSSRRAVGLTPDGGHLTGGTAGPAGRMSVCWASVASTPWSFGSRLPAWIETGRPVAHVAAEIGVREQVLGRWVRLQRQAASAGDTARVLDVDERAELERLRRENAELRFDRAFLKTAAAFFVSEQNR